MNVQTSLCYYAQTGQDIHCPCMQKYPFITVKSYFLNWFLDLLAKISPFSISNQPEIYYHLF